MNEADALLVGLNLFADEPGQDIIMKAVAGAEDLSEVVLLELTPVEKESSQKQTSKQRARRARKKKKGEKKQEPPIGEAWHMRCRADFATLVVFLNKIEKRGVTFDTVGFRADATGDTGGIECEVVMRVFSEKLLQELRAEAAKKKKAVGKEADKVKDDENASRPWPSKGAA